MYWILLAWYCTLGRRVGLRSRHVGNCRDGTGHRSRSGIYRGDGGGGDGYFAGFGPVLYQQGLFHCLQFVFVRCAGLTEQRQS